MKKLKGKNAVIFIVICSIVYFSSYLTRHNYEPLIQDIKAGLAIGEDAIMGIVSTAMFLSYGIGQIITGILGDKFKPRTLIFIALIATSVCNLGMIFMKNIVMMAILWGINGFIQALFWPPLVRMMVENLNDGDYSKACVWVSVGSSCGTIFVYLISAVCVWKLDWRYVFVISAASALIVSAAWLITTKKIGTITLSANEKTPDTENPTVGNVSISRLVIMSGMIMIIIGIVLQGILRDGLTTWMPTFIKDTYQLNNALSILVTTALPVFATISFSIASVMQSKINNELLTSVVLFGIAAVASFVMVMVINNSAIAAILIMALITACMHGVNLMLISRVPHQYARYGHVSTISGVLNAFTYVGSAISGYGLAALKDNLGWSLTFIACAVIAAVGMIVCLLNVRRWKKFSAADKES